MKTLNPFFTLLLVCLISISCFKDSDDVPVTKTEINDFIWRGMNIFYLYKDNVSDLADDRFSSNSEYRSFLNSNSPEAFFENLIYQRKTVDKYSWIVSNYFMLEQLFHGTTSTNGMDINLYYAPNSTTELVGVITYVLPNSPADFAKLKRGDVFYAINGQRLTKNNFASLYNQNTYTVNLGYYNDNGTIETTDDRIDSTGENIPLSKTIYTENPVYKNKIINANGINVGYLMYNGFVSDFEDELNTAFEMFKSSNIQHLVLDLRYNPGGSVSTSTYLASMITGQFTGQIFTKIIYNQGLQTENSNYTFQNQLENGNTINQLNLNKVYVLTSKGSASASEAIINGLSPYINVIQIGTNTNGKTQASITLYDSPNFRRQNINPKHTYAMQPLVANAVNKNNATVPSDGLIPSFGFEYVENPLNMGILGDENEPMLAIALADINGVAVKSLKFKSKISPKPIQKNNIENPFKGGMRID